MGLLDKFRKSKKNTDTKNDDRKDVGSTDTPCPLKKEKKPEPKIVAVEFLDGDDATELTTAGKHWVNLPRESKWVDPTRTRNIDRLGLKPRIKVRFNQPGRHKFKIKMLAGDDNIAYSDGERRRNKNFKWKGDEKTFTTGSDGTKIIKSTYLVNAAGLDKYTLEAVDKRKNKVTSTGSIETRRLIYYLELVMRDPNTHADVPAATSLATFEQEFDRHGITLVSVGRVTMDRVPNISRAQADNDLFKRRVKAGYAGSTAPAKEPYAVAIAYTDHLAVMAGDQKVTTPVVEVGPDKPKVGFYLEDSRGQKHYLWKGLVPGEDWFVGATYLPQGGTAPADEVAIPKDKIELVAADDTVPDRVRYLKVDVTGLPAGRGTISVRVNWVDMMRGGVAFPDSNLICVCTRAWWNDVSTESQNQTMIHEMGHKVGMTPNGTGKGPDTIPTYYDSSKGHVGPHCYNGIPDGQDRYDGSDDYAKSNCVMYGATNGKVQFCDHCTPAVRKQDLTEGWQPLP